MKALSSILPALLFCFGCASGGQWGHSPSYEPLDEEETALQGSTEYDPVMATRSPEKWKNKPVHLFGIVVGRKPAEGGLADVTLSMRTLEPRNLCEEHEEDSCRVTVSEREHARLHALLKLKSEDDIGPESVGSQSLVRIVGVINQSASSADGSPVIQVRYYRHWPRNYYVTTAARSFMRM
ncbi:MAG TPA: hypothetical protein VL137_14780 [Polyangiaceae bacterium]|jgi:hypothetical protein|nr:hypothetical protein [Polyangiaceae bacterium]